MDPVRRTLRTALAHQSSEEFVTKVLCDLLNIGNAYLQDEDWTSAAREFSNGLGIWQDVSETNIEVHEDLLERLYVGRAAAYHRMGKLEWAIKDCDHALAACKESRQALHRKALCLKDLGRYSEAYDCTTASLLISRLDEHVNELAQELAVHLGLKNPNSTGLPGPRAENGLNPLHGPPPVSFPNMPRGSTPPAAPDSPDAVDDLELIDDDLDSLLDSALNGQDETEISVPFKSSNSGLPMPTPQLPPTLFPATFTSLDPVSGGSTKPAALDTLDTLDDLDDLDDLVDLDDLSYSANGGGVASLGALDALDDLDALDELCDTTPSVSTPGCRSAVSSAAQSPRSGNNKKSNGHKDLGVMANPLATTHDFSQACSQCFVLKDRGTESFVHKPDLVHGCKQDILLCRRKSPPPSGWTRVRPVPKWMGFTGPYKLCKDKPKGLCKYGDDCNFAFNQLEIDVWTQERAGWLDRKRLFETAVLETDPVSSVKRLLQDHPGVYTFLCQECFSSEPRIVSERCRDRRAFCSNASARHTFDANKCLVFVEKGRRGKWTKVRSLSVLGQMYMCRNIRSGCVKKDECIFAHSTIELKTWRVQRDTGISHNEIVKLSSEYRPGLRQSVQKDNEKLPSSDMNKAKGSAGSGSKTLNLKMNFVCAQCWRDGVTAEPDKALQHCSGKAKHAWTRDRWQLLVRSSEKSRWVPVRPIPHSKNFPLNYDICHHILEKKKCTYSPCTFAHSQEEKELWTHMKSTNLLDMQQWYDMWLDDRNRLSAPTRATPTPSAGEKKNIVMPTDYPDLQSAFYCHLCDRHSNGERQWQRHITTEKHKDRVICCDGEEEALMWSHRFPGRSFDLCPKSKDGCSDGVSCDFAHGQEELQEWKARRDFLRQKLAKAREDMLIMPDDFNFGKYNFLLYD